MDNLKFLSPIFNSPGTDPRFCQIDEAPACGVDEHLVEIVLAGIDLFDQTAIGDTPDTYFSLNGGSQQLISIRDKVGDVNTVFFKGMAHRDWDRSADSGVPEFDRAIEARRHDPPSFGAIACRIDLMVVFHPIADRFTGLEIPDSCSTIVGGSENVSSIGAGCHPIDGSAVIDLGNCQTAGPEVPYPYLSVKAGSDQMLPFGVKGKLADLFGVLEGGQIRRGNRRLSIELVR